jgi:hypothetical protein
VGANPGILAATTVSNFLFEDYFNSCDHCDNPAFASLGRVNCERLVNSYKNPPGEGIVRHRVHSSKNQEAKRLKGRVPDCSATVSGSNPTPSPDHGELCQLLGGLFSGMALCCGLASVRCENFKKPENLKGGKRRSRTHWLISQQRTFSPNESSLCDETHRAGGQVHVCV